MISGTPRTPPPEGGTVSLLVRRLCTAAFFAAALPGFAAAQPVEPVLALAKKERQPLLDTLKELVSIETGSRDLEGLDRAARLIAARLSALGGKVELVDTSEGAYRMEDTPAKIGKVVHARFEGKGAKKILLLAHMDTVYLRGMIAKQPFRIEGDRAYGLGIADDKNGVALILHVLAMLKAMDFRGYGLITVLVNADEEMSSPGSRHLLTRVGAEHDAVFSCEASRVDSDKLALATAGIASVAIPAEAGATADVRVLRVSDYDGIERAVRERIRNKLIPDTQVEMTFERRRPPLEATAASRALGEHALRIYAELGKELVVDALAEGGGTDAAFASLNTKAPVIERFGLQGFGAHSNDAEYVAVDSIEPRLYLLARLIMDVSQGRDRK
ncbi:MAG: M20/M25/M40 family metallo-hydrolase [Betaproteobacteria bacterium]|nr:MAG: M20/M25/M40 family metallo-hydrolase [Betaproteobacteria bacterium]